MPTRRSNLYEEALRRFQRWLAEANKALRHEPTAATLATADRHGRPSARTVLLKGADRRGFVFYTNLRSRKARHLAANPRAALCFFWEPLMKQVLIEGVVKPVAAREADAYWALRDRTSQLGAWASRQSQPLDQRATLTARLSAYQRKFAGGPVPRPMHWSGYRLVPDRLEFWIAQPFRLNDRVLYQRRRGRWIKQLLYP